MSIVVDVVTGADPTLSGDVVAAAVTALVPRAGQRYQLAWALQDRPDLLLALRKAGAARISAPVCADCGKPLRTLQRRGEHWYCGGWSPAGTVRGVR